MIVDLGNIILEQIDGLPFIDKAAGVVRTITYKEQTPTGGTIKKSFPADCRISLDECNRNKRYLDLCPDDKKKSVLFFEDNGIRLTSVEGNYLNWRSSLDLVCWLNLPKLGVSDSCSYSATAIMGILAALPERKFNALDKYQYVSINIVGERSKQTNPYAKYSFDETINQYLMYPYDYFVLAFEIDFRMDKRCFKITDLQAELNCLKK